MKTRRKKRDNSTEMAGKGASMMEQNEILSRVDHTLLTPTATWDQVKALCDEGKQFGVASVCIPPRYVKRANDYAGGLKICTVIGFPNGYATPEVKVFETEDAIRDGADEIDMVINQGLAKAGDWEGVLTEIKAVKESCKGRILKVIIEACNFTQEEKITLCRVVSMSGAEFIKTSTGFAAGGATVEDVRLFREHISPDMRIKAAGGIRTFEQAQAMLEAGADRIGASALVALAR
jgi:deoxyribose-phosphate aldolase